jgi:hypothetical protein
MRIVMAFAVFLAACGQPATTTTEPTEGDGYAGSSGAGRIAEEPFTLAPNALVGLWSFDRSCGNYDLVFAADRSAQHYDVTAEGMNTSYVGTWATAPGNRVVLGLRRLGSEGVPEGETISYQIDVESAVADDLIGDFKREGDTLVAITARRCPEEDRD